MTLLNVNPKRKVTRSTSVFDNLFNELMSSNFGEAPKTYTNRSRPAVNIFETADHFRMELSVPGLSKKDIAIDVDKDILTIEANREIETKEGETVIKRGFDFNRFKRTFRLPETIDTSAITAKFKNGVLNIVLAKKEEAKELPPRTIAIG